jgi:hypothetical protein
MGMSLKDRNACYVRREREPRPWTEGNFGPVVSMPGFADRRRSALWLSEPRDMTARDIVILDKWFGARGRFPAVRDLLRLPNE